MAKKTASSKQSKPTKQDQRLADPPKQFTELAPACNEFFKQFRQHVDQIATTVARKNWLKYEERDFVLLEDKKGVYHITDEVHKFRGKIVRIVIKASLDTYSTRI